MTHNISLHSQNVGRISNICISMKGRNVSIRRILLDIYHTCRIKILSQYTIFLKKKGLLQLREERMFLFYFLLSFYVLINTQLVQINYPSSFKLRTSKDISDILWNESASERDAKVIFLRHTKMNLILDSLLSSNWLHREVNKNVDTLTSTTYFQETRDNNWSCAFF